jgi:murein DD-endopeptidase MepM/ murein hydrolase activator NlpD
MRRPIRLGALASSFLLAAWAVPPAMAATGGADAPDAQSGGSGHTGGLTAGDPSARTPAAAPSAGAASGRPVVNGFRVSPAEIVVGDQTRFGMRIDAFSPTVRVTVELVRTNRPARPITIDLGARRTGRHLVFTWRTPPKMGVGRYRVVLRAVDPSGRRAVASVKASRIASLVVSKVPPPPPPPPPAPDQGTPGTDEPPPAPAPDFDFLPGTFPVAGPHGFGGAGARFGAGRTGHIHQGQDVTAAEGTPLVAPRAGTVTWVAYQASGAGYYLVIRDDSGDRDYVFMHLQKDSTLVARGDHVAAGQAIARVGSTGESTGPHLHFEIWIGPWQAGGRPVDPLPQLRRWDGLD